MMSILLNIYDCIHALKLIFKIQHVLPNYATVKLKKKNYFTPSTQRTNVFFIDDKDEKEILKILIRSFAEFEN